MAGSEPYKWPPRCTLRFWHETDDVDDEGEEVWGFLEESHDRKLDFYETVMVGGSYDERIIRFEVVSESVRWPIWTERRLRQIEELIRVDLDADLCEVQVARLEGLGKPCSSGAMWQLHIIDREAHPHAGP